jgi:hypothetical protein
MRKMSGRPVIGRRPARTEMPGRRGRDGWPVEVGETDLGAALELGDHGMQPGTSTQTPRPVAEATKSRPCSGTSWLYAMIGRAVHEEAGGKAIPRWPHEDDRRPGDAGRPHEGDRRPGDTRRPAERDISQKLVPPAIELAFCAWERNLKEIKLNVPFRQAVQSKSVASSGSIWMFSYIVV